MTRRMTDGLIIMAVLALGATHLWAQGMGGRGTVHASQGGNSRVVRSVPVPSSGVVRSQRNVVGNGMGNGVAVNGQAFQGSGAGHVNINPAGPAAPAGGMNPAGPAPMGAAGPAALGAAGPAPIGAAGPAPIGAAGPAPMGATGAAGGGATVVGGGLPAGCTRVGGGVVCGK